MWLIFPIRPAVATAKELDRWAEEMMEGALEFARSAAKAHKDAISASERLDMDDEISADTLAVMNYFEEALSLDKSMGSLMLEARPDASANGWVVESA